MSEEAATWRLAGHAVRVTQLDRLVWPDAQVTKGELLRYYRDLAPVLLPYFRDRPVTLRVWPSGLAGPNFYQRDRPDQAPRWLRSTAYHPATADHVTQLPLIDDAAGLIWCANAGSIEFHLWSARLPDLTRPDQLIVDLDPGDEAPFAAVLRAAVRLHEALGELGLRCYAKTSGGRGLHVYLPLAPEQPYEEVRGWVRTLARQLADQHPDLIALARGATHQGRLVTIDYAQNSRGRNTAAPYTLRARPGAPVSTPVSWTEVAEAAFVPADLTLHTVPARVQRLGDLFAPVLAGGQHLPPLTDA
ncbi:MAG TPA: non-homologous end-joining DNA ligase [Thermomicrobiales bacterium]|nr:non-homologous end-joining DNA ligase [Thermomicrobiales bacterium]